MAITAAEVWRDYETDGVPSTGNHKVKKSDVRALLTGYEDAIDAYSSGAGSIAYAQRSSLFSNLDHDVNTMAWVYDDSTDVAYNGIYRKNGASGTGSWTRILDLPFSFIVASDVGSGTANSIQATTSVPVSDSALVWMNIFEANTASPVTVSFNGDSALTIKTNGGNNVAAGALVSGMIVLGIVSGSTFRLVSDQASAAILSGAEAAAAAALAAANAGFVFDTEADFEAANIPLVLQFVDTAGYYVVGDGGGHVKKRIATPSPAEAWHKQSNDGAWWEIAGSTINPRALGVKGDYTTDDTSALDDTFDFYEETRRPIQSGPMNARYVGSRQLPDGIIWRGAGAAKLDVWFPTEGDNLNVRPGFKHLTKGTNIWFSGAATASHSTNRTDHATISYGFYHQSNDPPKISGVGFIIDFDMYDADGDLTAAADDNRADYDCAFLQQGPLGEFDNCLFRGYANIQSLIIYGQASQSEVDSDYNKFTRCAIQGHAILTGDGSVAGVTQGSTGNIFIGCDLYSTADHHTPADGEYTKKLFLLDGYLNIAKGGMRGTTYSACHFRTRANDAAQFGYCDDVFMVGCTSEFPTLAGVSGADAAGKFINPDNHADTLYFIGFAAGNSGGAGIQNLMNTTANVVAVGGPFGSDISISKDGVFSRLGVDSVGNAFVQMGQDATSQTDGWQFQLDADQNDNFSARYNNSEKWRVDINGNAQFDGSVQSDGGAMLPSYTTTQLLDGTTKPAASNARVMVYVSNGASNKKLAISDGSAWRYADGVAV